MLNFLKKDIPVYSLLQNSKAGHSLIEVVRTGDNSNPEPAFLIPHRKNYYLFVFVKQGNSRHWVDFVPYTLKPGHFYFTTPHQVHLKEEMKPMDGLAVRFSDEFLQLEENRSLGRLPIIQNPANGHVLCLSPGDILFCENSLLRLLAEFTGNDPWKNHMLSALLQELLIHMSRLYNEQYGQAAPQRLVLQNFQSLINQHYRELHNAGAYADLLHLTPDYLNDLIKRQSGKTVLMHIHERVMVEAKRSLLHTENSVKEIADQLGFEDAAYFNRFFKRMAGTTPVLYRGQIREMYR